MKHLNLFATACLALGMPFVAFADDDYVEPYVWQEVYVQKVSQNGAFVAAQDDFSNCYAYDVATGRYLSYGSVAAGDSNYIANDGTMVGEDIAASFPAIMRDGKVFTPAVVKSYFGGAFESITPDARIATGYVSQGAYPLYLPVIYNLETDELTALPYPTRDLFGDRAQGYIPHAISDDGRTIAGMVMDGSGFFDYPIIWKQADDGTWSYSQPTAKLFNPDGLVPWAPGDDNEPDWDTMEKMGKDQHFGGTMAVSPDGKMVVTSQIVMPEGDLSTQGVTFRLWYFNTEDDSLGPLPEGIDIAGRQTGLLATQVLPDGTVVATSSPNEFFPFTAYMLLPGADEFILFSDWLEEKIPAYYPWLEDTLGMYDIIGSDQNGPIFGDYIVTGQISMSQDLSVIAGGLPIAPFFSYIYYDPSGKVGVGAVEAEDGLAAPDGPAVYYNLQGIPVERPTRGIYIVNGKKVLVN